MKHYLALDLGGTQIKYGIINEEGTLSDKGKIPSRCDSFDHLKQDLESIKNTISKDYEAVVVSLPGRIDTEAGIAHTGGSFKFLVDAPFQKQVETIFQAPATIANDAKCAAAAELWKGSLQDKKSGVVLIIGTGLGGGVILNQEVYMGQTLAAAELCFMAVNYDTIFDVDYSAFLFSRVATSALIQYYARLKQIDSKSVDGIQVFDAYNAKDPDAVKAVQWLSQNIAITIYSLQSILDVECYSIGGGISAQDSLFIEVNAKLDELFEKLSVSPVHKPIVQRCRFGNDANLVGALYYHLKKQKG